MKIAISLIAIIAVGVALWFLLQGTEPTNTDTADTTENVTEESEGDSVSNEEGATEDDTSSGTDIGMEFPIVDSDTDVSVDADADVRVFNVGGENFSFGVREIRVQEGDTVTVNFTSNGGFHDFSVDEFDARSERVNAGQSSSVTFVADQRGTFEYYCSVGNHRQMGMVGTLIVE